MPQDRYPLLSQAATILPLVRGHIVDAAAHCSLPVGFSLDMVPILEEDLFGYELTPIGVAETCLTLGCKPDGEPVLRKESISAACQTKSSLATLFMAPTAGAGSWYFVTPINGACFGRHLASSSAKRGQWSRPTFPSSGAKPRYTTPPKTIACRRS